MSSANGKIFHLLFGYCRIIQEEIKYQIIPKPIIILCIQFYAFNKPFVCLKRGIWDFSSRYLPHIYLSDLSSKTSAFHWKCKLIDLKTSHRRYRYEIDNNTALVSAYNIKLPKFIITLIKDTYTLSSKLLTYHDSFDIIFHGGSDSDCVGYIIDPNQYQTVSPKGFIESYIWKLPSTVSEFNRCDNLIFSQKYGLIGLFSPGWYEQSKPRLYSLSFNVNDENYVNYKQSKSIGHWDWNLMNNSPYKNRRGSCLTFINEDNVLLCGGEKHSWSYKHVTLYSDVDLYNITSKKWIRMKNMTNKRCNHGIFVNDNRIFVGGGTVQLGIDQFYKNRVEFCDLNKNIWVPLLDTDANHENKPVLWIENEYMLHIASTNANVIEMLDLRENKWMSWTDTVQQYFNLPETSKEKKKFIQVIR
eukprot:30061_1